MMRVGHADGTVSAVATLAAHHQRNNASQVGLECDRHQVEHQVGMLFKSWGNSRWPIQRRKRLRCRLMLLGFFDALFNLANRIEVFAQLAPVACPQRVGKTCGIGPDEIKNAAILPHLRGARHGVGGFAIAK